MKVNLFILFISTLAHWLINTSTFAQSQSNERNRTIDSLQNLIQSAKEDTAQVKAFNELSRQYFFSDPEKAFGYAKKARAVAEKLSDKNGIALAYKNMGVVNYLQGQYSDAMQNYSLSLMTYRTAGNERGMANNHNNMGIIFRLQGNYPEAINHYLKSLSIEEKFQNKRGMAASYNNVGAVYYHTKNFKKALEYYNKSLVLMEKLNDRQGIAAAYNNIGIIHENKANYKLALNFYFKALKIREQENNTQEIAISCNNIGGIYAEEAKELDNPQKVASKAKLAFDFLGKAMQISEKIGDKYSMTYSLSVMGSLHKTQGNVAEAINYFQKSLSIAKQTGAFERQLNACGELVLCYVENENYQKAHGFNKIHTALKDSLFNEEKSKEIGKLEARYEFEKSEAERKRIEEEQQRQLVVAVKRRNLLQYSGIFIGIVILLALVFVVGRVNLSVRLSEGLVFFTFLLFFEFLLVLTEPYVEEWTGGTPLYKLIINSALALLIFPAHQFFEGKLKMRVFRTKRLKVKQGITKLIILFLLSGGNAYSQNPTIDSLENVIKTVKTDTGKINALHALAWEYIYSNPDTAFAISKNEYDLAKNKGLKKQMADALNTQGGCFWIKGDYEKARERYLLAFQIFEDQYKKMPAEESKKGMSNALNNIGLVCHSEGNYPVALNYFLRSLKLDKELLQQAEQNPNKTKEQLKQAKLGVAYSLNNIGEIYRAENDLRQALGYYQRSLRMFEALNNQEDISRTLNNIGTIYDERKAYRIALEYYQRSLKIQQKLDDKTAMSATLNNIGSIYQMQGDSACAVKKNVSCEAYYSKAMRHFVISLVISRETNEKYGISNALNHIGKLHLQAGRVQQGIENCKKGLSIATEISHLELQKSACSCLSACYENSGDYQNAYEHHKQFSQLKDSLFSEDKSKEIGKLEAKYEFEKAGTERKKINEEALRVENEEMNRKNLLQHSGILVFIVLLLMVVMLLVRIKIKPTVIEGLVFFTFLLFFEFILVLTDPYVDVYTSGIPLYKLAINACFAAMVFPLHSFFEEKLKSRVSR
ncbi:tetratricopeptide repeat protein [Bacteroidales bacterium AH-315-I05]|nr:tetratricopeptide repeat protein [Bacteroidales bacterium AH-315-I05]